LNICFDSLNTAETKKNLDDNFISLRGFRAIEGPKEHFSKEFEAIWR
jgi:hypothetical protein